MSPWTEERIDQLKVLWAEGLSGSQIAVELGGITRNAVIGKVHRLGLVSPQSNTAPRERVPRVPRLQGAHAPRPKPHREASPDLPADIGSLSNYETAPIPDDFRGLTLLDLKDNHCRYPRGGDGSPTLFCGQPRIDGSSYCPACHRRCHAGFVRRPMNITEAERARRVHQGRFNNTRRRAA